MRERPELTAATGEEGLADVFAIRGEGNGFLMLIPIVTAGITLQLVGITNFVVPTYRTHYCFTQLMCFHLFVNKNGSSCP